MNDGRRATGTAGTGALVRATFRRDRVRLLVWAAAILVLVVVTAESTKGLFPTQADLDRVAATTADNPAAIAFNGPPVALDTMGGQIAFQLGAFGLAMVGLASLLLTSRFTRAEEDSGRLELVRALPVGRHAPMVVGLVLVAALDVVVGALTTVTLLGEDLPVAGSVALGASMTAVGWLFVGLTLVTAQLTDNPRVASGAAGAVLGAGFLLRAVGDATDGTLSWASPIGLAQKSRPYGGERWWPLLLCLAIAGGLVAAAVALANRRDFGSGLFPPRPGPARAAPGLGSPLGLAVRLHRGAVLWWAVGTLVMAVAMGSLAGSIEDFVSDNDTLADYLARTGGASLADGFLATSLLLLALLPAGAAVQLLLRARSEELEGRAEAILATPASRTRWSSSHALVAVAGSTLAQLVGGLGLGVSAAITLGDAGEVLDLTAASAAYLPAIWLVAAAAIVLLGVVPRASVAAWVVWSFCLVVAYFDTLVDFPALVRDVSPFEHVPFVPVERTDAAPLVVLAAVAVAAALTGQAGLRRRDLGR